jgi:hypothetical protein
MEFIIIGIPWISVPLFDDLAYLQRGFAAAKQMNILPRFEVPSIHSPYYSFHIS